MAGATTTVTVIPILLAQFATGGGLFYGVQKFFKETEERLSADTKQQIASWLMGVKVGRRIDTWPETLTKLFDRVFGQKHFGWTCFWRSSLASLLVGFVASSVAFLALDSKASDWEIATGVAPLHGVQSGVVWSLTILSSESPHILQEWSGGWISQLVELPLSIPLSEWLRMFGLACVTLLITNALPGYFSLLETRYLLHLFRTEKPTVISALLVLDILLTAGGALAWDGAYLSKQFNDLQILKYSWLDGVRVLAVGDGWGERKWMILPSLWTSMWLWLYAGSGFLLKAAHRFDICVGFINRCFDIKNKPLQAIGYIAGALFACTYWASVILDHLI